MVNPDEPPMPPKVRHDQAVHFAESFLRGQPRRAAIASTLFRDKLDQLHL
jgi:pyruvate dehydrogenase (quinone)/pyruvate oxidase